MKVNEIEEIFSKYVSENFDLENIDIRRKFNHSKRVMLIADDIAKSEEFNTQDRFLATTVGLLHDYGRFYQITAYNTFDDLKSIDHGDLGADFLFGRGDIKNFPINVSDYDEIYDSIKYHNNYNVPETLSEHNKKILSVVRDADKLDILRLWSISGINFVEDNSNISSDIDEQFYLQKQLLITKDITNNDRIIITLGYIFDLNYSYSFKYIKEKNIIDNFFKYLNDKEKFQPYFEYIKKYIDIRIGA